MRHAFKQVIETGIARTIEAIHLHGEYITEPHLIYRKISGVEWRGTIEPRISVRKTVNQVEEQIALFSRPFMESLFTCHPEYAGMVGVAGFTKHRLKPSSTFLLENLIKYAYRAYGTFALTDSQISQLADEAEEFFTSRSITVRFQAQLINFKMTSSSLQLPEALQIRKLSEEEVTGFHGGPVDVVRMMNGFSFGIHQYIFEGQYTATKAFGEQSDADEGWGRAKEILSKAVLSLRTFKSGHIGYNFAHFTCPHFCPFALGTLGCGDAYIPLDTYELSAEEEIKLAVHSAKVFSVNEGAMQVALRRLSDASTRSEPEDRSVDAMIGMESILLASLSERSELKHRLALRYASLFQNPLERARAFKRVGDLYNLRSRIAHGDDLRTSLIRVGDEKLELKEAAHRATEELRLLVELLLPYAQNPVYKKDEFWDKLILGVASFLRHAGS